MIDQSGGVTPPVLLWLHRKYASNQIGNRRVFGRDLNNGYLICAVKLLALFVKPDLSIIRTSYFEYSIL
jgi:hypothetical protein